MGPGPYAGGDAGARSGVTGGPLFDAAVIGGGLSGGVTALFLAQGGMRVALVDKRGLGAEASGVNAGTLSVQVKEAALVRYAMRSNELWETSADWLGIDMGFRRLGGLTIAITDEEVALLRSRMDPRIEAGAPHYLCRRQPGPGDRAGPVRAHRPGHLLSPRRLRQFDPGGPRLARRPDPRRGPGNGRAGGDRGRSG